MSKRELLAEVWRQPYGGADKTVDVHLSWLRRKLGETARRAPATCTPSAGVGVKLESRPEAVRRQLTLLVAATTTMVLLAFLLPPASWSARVAEARALDAAQAQTCSACRRGRPRRHRDDR